MRRASLYGNVLTIDGVPRIETRTELRAVAVRRALNNITKLSIQHKEQVSSKFQNVMASFQLSHFVLAGSAVLAVKYPTLAPLFIAVFYLQPLEKAEKDRLAAPILTLPASALALAGFSCRTLAGIANSCAVCVL